MKKEVKIEKEVEKIKVEVKGEANKNCPVPIKSEYCSVVKAEPASAGESSDDCVILEVSNTPARWRKRCTAKRKFIESSSSDSDDVLEESLSKIRIKQEKKRIAYHPFFRPKAKTEVVERKVKPVKKSGRPTGGGAIKAATMFQHENIP